MASSQQGEDLRFLPMDDLLKRIELIDDYDEAEELADTMEVSMDGVQNINEMKSRLRLHVQKKHGVKSGLSKVGFWQ